MPDDKDGNFSSSTTALFSFFVNKCKIQKFSVLSAIQLPCIPTAGL